jgi:hypothetical protein
MVGYWTFNNYNLNLRHAVGDRVDSLNGVYVYYNGGVSNNAGRNTTSEGYNLGIKYQCVEFVKRYYYEYLKHKMPDGYGHAKDFFDKNLKDGQKNKKRNLIQYSNPSVTKPKVDDLLVLDRSLFNKFGHVGIVSRVGDKTIEIVQQNPGPFGKSRQTYTLIQIKGKWRIKNSRVLGWLRKE